MNFLSIWRDCWFFSSLFCTVCRAVLCCAPQLIHFHIHFTKTEQLKIHFHSLIQYFTKFNCPIHLSWSKKSKFNKLWWMVCIGWAALDVCMICEENDLTYGVMWLLVSLLLPMNNTRIGHVLVLNFSPNRYSHGKE